MELNEFETRPFAMFDRDWALVTAGDLDSFNSMTVSWGSAGTLWNKPVIMVFIKPVRYTAEFMERNEYFTVSTYTDEYRSALSLIGSRSGRDSDKIAKSGLTPVAAGKSVTYREASRTFLLKKIYQAPFDAGAVPEFAHDLFYAEEDEHIIFIGEVIDVIEGEKR